MSNFSDLLKIEFYYICIKSVLISHIFPPKRVCEAPPPTYVTKSFFAMEDSKKLKSYVDTINMFSNKFADLFSKEMNLNTLNSITELYSHVIYLIGFVESWFETKIMNMCDNDVVLSIVSNFTSIIHAYVKIKNLITNEDYTLQRIFVITSDMFEHLSSLINNLSLCCIGGTSIWIFKINKPSLLE
jgi:uncharacterized membrane protein (DUF485 family)